MTIIRLSCKGKDLSARLAESIATIEKHGPEWCSEVAKAQRIYPGCVLVAPDELPSDEQIAALWPVDCAMLP